METTGCPHEREVGLYADMTGKELMNVLCVACLRVRTPTEEEQARSKAKQGG